MSQASARRKPNDQPALLDTELEHLPPELRWREWMGRVEAVIFAASEPVPRDVLARVVGKSCNLDLLIEDIRVELAGRPYELVSVAGGWQHRTKKAFADVIRGAFGTAAGQGGGSKELSQSEALVLMCIAYFQPITRGELSSFFGKEVSRDLIGVLRTQDLIASGPRSPQPGAPYTYVTTKNFLSQFGFDTLRQLPDFEALEDAGLLSKEKLLAGGIPAGLANREGEDDVVED
ncbi:MAG: SMC-Scp complex subunit ScpB [Mesorhizobium sp.]|uniref:SMC-Scp complex subunit ScpB n=1 Tax=Mesorhizobium sp. TaxID=1871066 RepID=UPI000FE4B83B|nr:SMC-Scp complex subunit ScpB [Mesorhizobium sp.]RWE22356.1 MAG: SMC-Scp complex subunit ScpB [Mesorhizobium sp.]